jgi:glycosyltransferase involved in cell wall biosynthesis
LHVAFVLTRADAIGGATVHVRDLARGLEDAGHRVVVLVGGSGEVLYDLSRHQVEYRSLRWLGRPIHPIKDVFAVAELRRVLVHLKPDLVCAHTAKAGLVGRLAAAWAGVPSLYTPHGWSIGDRVSRTHAWVFRVAERIAARYSEAIINVCEAERSLARRHGIAPDSKFSVIHNGVPDIDPTLKASPDLSPPTILMVARFDPPKDHQTLLSAMAAMQNASWRLELVGNGRGREEARRLADRLGLNGRVTFADGGCSVAHEMAQAQIFVLCSRSEALPLSILEAMRAGLPVVASDVGGVREAVVDGETGFLVRLGDSQALSEALSELTGNSLLRRKFGAAGRRRYELHFTFDQMLGQTIAMYRSVLPGRVEAPLSREAISGR